ncbi:MAG: hypothetical protein ACK5EA_19550 [Planctomycetaceae bacterium]
MTNKTLKRPAPPAGGIAGLDAQRRLSKEAARQTWGILVREAAETELNSDQVERLGAAADVLEITDNERSFNDDVDAWRWVQQAQADIAAIRAKDWPTQLQRLAEEIRQLDAQRQTLQHQRTVGRVELETIGPMTREIGDRQQKHPRLFPLPTN